MSQGQILYRNLNIRLNLLFFPLAELKLFCFTCSYSHRAVNTVHALSSQFRKTIQNSTMTHFYSKSINIFRRLPLQRVFAYSAVKLNTTQHSKELRA